MAASRRLAPAFITLIESTQYASALYQKAVEQFGLLGSMSALANPYQNTQVESFMKTLKVEEVYLAGYEKLSDVAARLPYFIEKRFTTNGACTRSRLATREEKPGISEMPRPITNTSKGLSLNKKKKEEKTGKRRYSGLQLQGRLKPPLSLNSSYQQAKFNCICSPNIFKHLYLLSKSAGKAFVWNQKSQMFLDIWLFAFEGNEIFTILLLQNSIFPHSRNIRHHGRIFKIAFFVQFLH
jgi:hypothetical protein